MGVLAGLTLGESGPLSSTSLRWENGQNLNPTRIRVLLAQARSTPLSINHIIAPVWLESAHAYPSNELIGC